MGPKLADEVGPKRVDENSALRGTVTEGKVAMFKGIPYAASPFGANRFLPPRPVEPWQGVREALRTGPRCLRPPYAAPFSTKGQTTKTMTSPITRDWALAPTTIGRAAAVTARRTLQRAGRHEA